MTRVRIESRSCHQSCRKNGVFTLTVTLPAQVENSTGNRSTENFEKWLVSKSPLFFFVAGSKDTIQQPTVYVVEWIVRLVYGAVPLAIV